MTDWTTTRRSALTAMAATIAFPVVAAGGGKRPVRLIAGTYAREGGKGVYPISFDPDRDIWQVGAPVSGIDDASFGVGGGPGGAYYFVREKTAAMTASPSSRWTRQACRACSSISPAAALGRASCWSSKRSAVSSSATSDQARWRSSGSNPMAD